MFQIKKDEKIINSQKIDNGDGSYTTVETWQYIISTTIFLNDLKAQKEEIEKQIADLPKDALPEITE